MKGVLFASLMGLFITSHAVAEQRLSTTRVKCPAAVGNRTTGEFLKRNQARCFVSVKAAEEAGFITYGVKVAETPAPNQCAKPVVMSSGAVSIEQFYTLVGGKIMARDGQFLGDFNRESTAQDSISNNFGPYGNNTSLTSLFNAASAYGSSSSALSAYNPAASTAPVVMLGGEIAAYITTNKLLKPRVHPDLLKVWFKLEDF